MGQSWSQTCNNFCIFLEQILSFEAFLVFYIFLSYANNFLAGMEHKAYSHVLFFLSFKNVMFFKRSFLQGLIHIGKKQLNWDNYLDHIWWSLQVQFSDKMTFTFLPVNLTNISR